MEDATTTRNPDAFIDVVRRDLTHRPASTATLARDDLLRTISDMQYHSAGRARRFRDAITRICHVRGFSPTVSAARFLIVFWRERADEIEDAFHHTIDAADPARLRVSSDLLAQRSAQARLQLQTALRRATDSPGRRAVELRFAVEHCVTHLGYDATFIEASRLTTDFRADANDLESALCDVMFDDLCSRLGPHAEALPKRAA